MRCVVVRNVLKSKQEASVNSDIDIKTISMAERDAKKLIDGATDDYEMIFRMRVSKELGIGIWDSYFNELSIYQLAFEAFLYAGLQEKQYGKDPEQEAEELVNLLKKDKDKDNMIMPSGFDFDDEDEEIIEMPLKDLSGLS